jgi:uncharacterized protein (TIGR00725 family)
LPLVAGRQISVFGAGVPTEREAALAEEVGRLLAEAGVTLVTGGLGGVMEAASRGAAGAGGTVVAVIPGDDRRAANPYASVVVATGAGQARNVAVAASGDAGIAIGQGWGTLSEIALARKLGRPVVVLVGPELDGLEQAATAEEAVRLALELSAAPGPRAAAPGPPWLPGPSAP